MKVGSIVVVVPFEPVTVGPMPKLNWLPVRDEKTPYMIRDINKRGSVVFEEGIIGWWADGNEVHLKKEFVKEILPPEDISEVIEECMLVENTIANTLAKMKSSLGKFIKRQ